MIFFTLRKDKLLTIIDEFIQTVTYKEFTDEYVFDLAEVFSELDHRVPIILMNHSDIDPYYEVRKLCNKSEKELWMVKEGDDHLITIGSFGNWAYIQSV